MIKTLQEKWDTIPRSAWILFNRLINYDSDTYLSPRMYSVVKHLILILIHLSSILSNFNDSHSSAENPKFDHHKFREHVFLLPSPIPTRGTEVTNNTVQWWVGELTESLQYNGRWTTSVLYELEHCGVGVRGGACL